MAWTTSIADLRRTLSDGAKDKLRYRKRVIGIQNGTNLVFKTFEYRRTQTLVGAVAPIGVYVDDASVAIVSDDVDSGEFTLAVAPTDAQALRATYYLQWFTDTELTEFLVVATQWLGFGTDFTSIADSFQPSALKYGACTAYRKLALFWAQNMSEIYQLQDAPLDKEFDPVKQYGDLAELMCKDAMVLRDDVYTRQGRAKAPRFATFAGNVRDVKPPR